MAFSGIFGGKCVCMAQNLLVHSVRRVKAQFDKRPQRLEHPELLAGAEQSPEFIYLFP